MAQKVYKSVIAVIRIIDPKTEEIKATHIKTIDDFERRKWLQDTIMWALMNGMIAEVINKELDKDDAQ